MKKINKGGGEGISHHFLNNEWGKRQKKQIMEKREMRKLEKGEKQGKINTQRILK
jgi:hypothetical protein